jgi:putative transposase
VRLNDAVRERLRVQAGRQAQPSAAILDSQSVKTTEGEVCAATTPTRKVNGRKRHVWVDTRGHLLRALVHAADVSDSEGGRQLLKRAGMRLQSVLSGKRRSARRVAAGW